MQEWSFDCLRQAQQYESGKHMVNVLRIFQLLLAIGLSGTALAGPYPYELLKDPEVREGVTIETFTFDAAPVDAAAVAAGAAALPQPNPETDQDEDSPYTPTAKAMLGYIDGSKPTKLVVLCHGLNGDVFGDPEAYRAFYHHVTRLTTEDVAVMAINYRNNYRFPIGLGAHDVIAGTLAVKDRVSNGLPPGSARGQAQRSEQANTSTGNASNRQAVSGNIETVYLWGISMGGAISGTALSEALYVTDDANKPIFDHWIGVEPLVNYGESYLEASGAAPGLAREMELDSGGTPNEVPDEYRRRTVVMNADRIAQAGLKTMTIVHAINDGLVPYNQAREMATTAVQAGIPTQLFTVVRKSPEHGDGDNTRGRPGGNNPDYTGTNTFLGGGDGHTDEANVVDLAGHAADFDETHPVIRTSFEQLQKLIEGSYDTAIPYREHCVDDQDGGSDFCTRTSALGE